MRMSVLAFAAAGLFAAGAAEAAEASNPLYVALGSPANWTISGAFRVRAEIVIRSRLDAVGHTSVVALT